MSYSLFVGLLRLRLAPLNRFKLQDLLWVFVCFVFAMSLCVSVYMCFVVTCWERADVLALGCGV